MPNQAKPPPAGNWRGLLYLPFDDGKGQTLFHFNVKTLFRITGKMSQKQTDKTSNKLANAALLVALAILIYAVRWW